MNAQYPELEHWSVPVADCLPPMVEIDDA
jgi:hypothetical protein